MKPEEVLDMIKRGVIQIGTQQQIDNAEFHVCGTKKADKNSVHFNCCRCRCLIYGDPRFAPKAKKICVKCLALNAQEKSLAA